MLDLDLNEFIEKPKPRSVAEAKSMSPFGDEATITKAAFAKYLASFLEPTGENRRLIKELAPYTVQFVTQHSYESADLTKRAVLIARIIEEIYEKLPAIIIVDGGMTGIPIGIGGGISGAQSQGKHVSLLTRMFKVNLDILAIAEDKTTAERLAGIVSLTMDPAIRNKSHSNLLRSGTDGGQWEVRMPLGPSSIAAPNATPMNEDGKNRLWVVAVSGIELEYEGWAYLQHSFPEFSKPTGIPDTNLQEAFPVQILCPASIRAGETVRFYVQNGRLDMTLVVDKPELVELDTKFYMLRARKHGVFKFRAMRRMEILAEKTVTISS